MKAFLTNLLGGIYGYVAVAVLAAVLSGAGAWRVTSWAYQADIANLKATHANERADANQKAIDGLVGSVNAALAGNKTAADAANARLAKTASLMEKLSHVQDSKACASSPAMRTYLDSLRGQ